jgi:hypothetical protein
MSATQAALEQIDDVAEEGDLSVELNSLQTLEASCEEDAITLPCGRVIYPPRIFGTPVDEIACALLDAQDPARARFLRLIGPPGTGKSQIARVIAYKRWLAAGRSVEERNGVPFYGLVELSPGPSSDEFYFRYDYVPLDGGGAKLIDASFVEAMRNGWLVVIDEVNTARDVALLSINSVLDGRLALHMPATGETVIAQPGFGVVLSYNPGLVGATDIPDAWRSRFPATVEVRTNWAALLSIGAPPRLVEAAMRLDDKRLAGDEGLVWTPQFRDIEALTTMIERTDERVGIALFVSSLHEQVQTGAVQAAEASAACRMLDEAGYGRLKVKAGGPVPHLERFARAVTR